MPPYFFVPPQHTRKYTLAKKPAKLYLLSLLNTMKILTVRSVEIKSTSISSDCLTAGLLVDPLPLAPDFLHTKIITSNLQNC